MTPADMAALRALAQNVLDTWGGYEAGLEYKEAMAEIHPAAVLALLDENARMREALERALRALSDAEPIRYGLQEHWQRHVDAMQAARTALAPRA